MCDQSVQVTWGESDLRLKPRQTMTTTIDVSSKEYLSSLLEDGRLAIHLEAVVRNIGVISGILKCPIGDYVACQPRELKVLPGGQETIHVTIYPPSIESIRKLQKIQFLCPSDNRKESLSLPLSFKLRYSKMKVGCFSSAPEISSALPGALIERHIGRLESDSVYMVIHNDGNATLKFSLEFNRKSGSCLQNLEVYHIHKERRKGKLVDSGVEVCDGQNFTARANQDMCFRIHLEGGTEAGMFQEEILIIPENEWSLQSYTSCMGWCKTDSIRPHQVDIIGFVDLPQHPFNLSGAAMKFPRWDDFPDLSDGIIQQLYGRPNECIGAGLMMALLPVRLCNSISSEEFDMESLHALVSECSDIQSAVQLAGHLAESADPKSVTQDHVSSSGESIFRNSTGGTDLIGKLTANGVGALDDFYISMVSVDKPLQSVYRALFILCSQAADQPAVNKWEVASVWLQASCREHVARALFQDACRVARKLYCAEIDSDNDSQNMITMTHCFIQRLIPPSSLGWRAAREQLKVLEVIAKTPRMQDVSSLKVAQCILEKTASSCSRTLPLTLFSVLDNEHVGDSETLFLDLAPSDIRNSILSVLSNDLRTVVDASIEMAKRNMTEMGSLSNITDFCRICFSSLNFTGPIPRIEEVCGLWGYNDIGVSFSKMDEMNKKIRPSKELFFEGGVLLLRAVVNELMKEISEEDGHDCRVQCKEILELMSSVIGKFKMSWHKWCEVPPAAVEYVRSFLKLKRDSVKDLKRCLDQLFFAVKDCSKSR